MKLHLPKILLAAVLALVPCAAGATTYGWDNGAPTATVDGGTAAIAYPTTATDAAGNVTATGTDPLFYNQTGDITSLSADGYDVKLQLNGSALSGSLTADSLWLTGDKVFTAGTGQAQITTSALYLVGSQMKLTSTSSTALQNVGEIFIGWTSSGTAAATNAAIYATETTTITRDITVVDSGVTGAGKGAKITVKGGQTLTLEGNIIASGKTLTLTGLNDNNGSGILSLKGSDNNIETLYLSGSPSSYGGNGYSVQVLLESGSKTTIGTLSANKVNVNENSIRVKNGAQLILTTGIQTSLGADISSGSSLLMVDEGGTLTFSSGFNGEFDQYLSLSGAGTVSNAGSLSISGSMSLSNAIKNTGTITFKNGAAIELGGLTATQVTLDESLTGLQTLTTTYSLVANTGTGQVIKAGDANITLKLSGAAQNNFTWSGDNSAVSRIDSIVYNIAVGGSAGYNTVKTEFGTNTGYINVLGTLTGLSEAPAYAVKGNGIVEITADITEPSNLNEFAGTIQITSGTLKLNDHPEKIAAARHVEVLTGGTLQAWSGTSVEVNKDIILNGGTLFGAANSIWTGDIEIKTASFLQAPDAADKTTTIRGNITGDGNITKTGAGTLKVESDISSNQSVVVESGTFELAGNATLAVATTIKTGATLALNSNTTATGTLSGQGTVKNAGSTAASVTLKNDFSGTLSASSGELSAQWSDASDVGTSGRTLASVAATGGNLTVTNVGSSGISITDIEIGAGRTVGVYTGDTASDKSVISLKGELTAGEGSGLKAGLSTLRGSSLTLNSFLDLGGNSLYIIDTKLSGDVLNWADGDSITLFTNVGSWGGYDLGVLDSVDDISWIFSNVGEWDNRYNYTLSSVVKDSVGSIILNRSEVPEPGTATLSLLALAGLCSRRRRKK